MKRYCLSFLVALAMSAPSMGIAAEAAKEQGDSILALQRKVQELQDVEAVKQLHYRYVDDLTFGRWDDLVSLFTDDAVLEVFMDRKPIVGIEAIRDTFFNEIAKSGKHDGKEANITVHPIVSVNGDDADLSSIIYFVTQPDPDNAALQLIQGIYKVKYKKVDGAWKMSYIKWTARLALGPKPPGPPPPGLDKLIEESKRAN